MTKTKNHRNLNMNLIEKFHKYVAQTSHEPLGIEIERAEDIYIYDTSGKR